MINKPLTVPGERLCLFDIHLILYKSDLLFPDVVLCLLCDEADNVEDDFRPQVKKVAVAMGTSLTEQDIDRMSPE